MAERIESERPPEDDVAAAAFMTRLAATPVAVTSRLAGADLLWWKAQLLRRWESERRVTAPLEAIEPVQIVAGLAAVAVLAMWAVSSVAHVLALIRQ